MTRFGKEISGELGEYWVKNAKEEVSRLLKEADANIILEDSGAIKWKSSGNYVPDDCCEKLIYGGFAFDREATRIAREQQQKNFLDEYRKNMENHVYSEEELFEMRSAFGGGKTIVDVFTGKTIKL